MKNPIATYCCQEVEGWNKLPDSLVLPRLGEEEFTCGFFREEDGIHFLATVTEFDNLTLIHVSIAPIRFFKKDWTDEDHMGHIFDVTPEVIKSFFGDRSFMRQPDDPRRPQVKHYFSILEAQE